MAGCKDNLDRCNANCCKFLVFKRPFMTEGQINYFELHSNTMVKKEKTGFYIIIYRPCAMLRHNGECGTYSTRPKQCQDAYTLNKNSNLFVPYCIHKPDEDSIVLTERELGRIMNGI